jgi:hypothetical protein
VHSHLALYQFLFPFFVVVQYTYTYSICMINHLKCAHVLSLIKMKFRFSLNRMFGNNFINISFIFCEQEKSRTNLHSLQFANTEQHERHLCLSPKWKRKSIARPICLSFISRVNISIISVSHSLSLPVIMWHIDRTTSNFKVKLKFVCSPRTWNGKHMLNIVYLRIVKSHKSQKKWKTRRPTHNGRLREGKLRSVYALWIGIFLGQMSIFIICWWMLLK